MTVNAEWIQTLWDEIAGLRATHLAPMESGWVRVYRCGYGGETENITEEVSASLRKSIAGLQAVAARYHEEHVHRA